jgi:EmrB/QacA subfamily drug resistance transporter
LAVLACLQFMLVLDATVVNIALPSIKRDLGFTQANLAWVVDAYLLVAGGFLWLGGRVADLFGRRRVFVAGAVAFATGSLLSGVAQDQAMLVGARAVQGLGEALAGPAALSIITVLFTDAKERTKALSIWGSLAGLAGVLGAIVSGVIVDFANWRWIFWVNLPVAAAVLAVTPRVVPGDRRRGRELFDLAGAVTVTGAITAVVYALLEANRVGWASATTLGLFAAAATLLAAFVASEGRSRSPLIPRRLLSCRQPRGAAGLMVLAASALYGLFFLVTLYMQLVLRWSPLHSGVAWLPFGAGIILGTGAASQLVPKVGVRAVMAVGMALAASGFGLLTQLSVHAHYFTELFPAMVLTAVGMGLALICVTVSAVSEATEADAGLASGVLTAAQQVGGALGLAVLVSLAASRATHYLPSGRAPGTAQVAGAHLAFGVGAGLLALGAALSPFLLGRLKTATMPPPIAPTQAEAALAHLPDKTTYTRK